MNPLVETGYQDTKRVFPRPRAHHHALLYPSAKIAYDEFGMTGYEQPQEDRAAVDLWHRTLQQVPSVYGRLVYLSSLRNPNTNRYEHHGFAARFGEDKADRVLRKNHEETFQNWLSLGVREKKGDIDTYLSSIEDNKRLVVETWLKIMPFRNLQPGGARGVEADLFLADFRVLLELLRSEYDAAEPDRGA